LYWGPAPKPPGFNALWTKAWEKGSSNHTAPMLQSPVTALGLLPSIALSSELVAASYHGKLEGQVVETSEEETISQNRVVF